MDTITLLQLAAELRRRAATASPEEKADLLFLANEYEAAASKGDPDKPPSISVKLPR